MLRVLLPTLALSWSASARESVRWLAVAGGMERAQVAACPNLPSQRVDLWAVRVEPARAEFRTLSALHTPEKKRLTAREWAEGHGLSLATNAGMYHRDLLSHVGLMVDGGKASGVGRPKNYKSVLAFHPKRQGIPAVTLADLEETTWERLEASYGTLVQNLRVVGLKRKLVWARDSEKWSASLLGVDGRGRILFLFSKTPLAVHDLGRCLLDLPIDLARAQYLEGGPEAALYLKAGDTTMELSGSHGQETAAPPGERGAVFVPLPNVIGVRLR